MALPGPSHTPGAAEEVQAVALRASDFILLVLLVAVIFFVVPKRIRKLLRSPNKPHSS
jgi:hypothetical protein